MNCYCVLFHKGSVVSQITPDSFSGFRGGLIKMPSEPPPHNSHSTEKSLLQMFNLSSVQIFSFTRQETSGAKIYFAYSDDAAFSFDETVYQKKPLSSPEAFDLMDLRIIQYFIEKTLLHNEAPSWLEPYKNLYFNARETYYTSKRLQALERTAQIKEMDATAPAHIKNMALISALALGTLFDIFFTEQRWGVSVLIFTLLALGISKLINKETCHTPFSWFLLFTTLGIATSYSIYSNYSLRFFNALALPLCFGAYTLSIYSGVWKIKGFSPVKHVLNKLSNISIGNAPKFIQMSKIQLLTSKNKKRPANQQFIKGLALGLPLLAIITLLLCSSDMIFSKMLSNYTTAFDSLDASRFITHAVVIVLGSLYSFGFLWSNRYPSEEIEITEGKKYFEPITSITIIALLCALYLVFTVVQFSYLYSPGAQLPEGFTYAEYARRGFFELILVSLINISVLLISTLFTKPASVRLQQILKGAYTLLALFSINLLISAFYRMHLYEIAYGFTELRLFVQFFMAFMGSSLLAIALWVWISRIPLFKSVLALGIGLYMVMNYINLDAVIANNNINRWKSTNHIDSNYLANLSEDASGAVFSIDTTTSSGRFLVLKYLEQHPDLQTDHDQWFEYIYTHQTYLKYRAQIEKKLQPFSATKQTHLNETRLE